MIFRIEKCTAMTLTNHDHLMTSIIILSTTLLSGNRMSEQRVCMIKEFSGLVAAVCEMRRAEILTERDSVEHAESLESHAR